MKHYELSKELWPILFCFLIKGEAIQQILNKSQQADIFFKTNWVFKEVTRIKHKTKSTGSNETVLKIIKP